jgi:hypothetical protein
VQQGKKAGVIVDIVQIVQDYVKLLAWVTAAQTDKSPADIDDGLATTEQPAKTVSMYIIKTQKLLGSFQTAVRRSHTPGLLLSSPSHAAQGLQFQRAPLVKTHYRTVRWTASIEPADEFFLRSKAGSLEVFQVRTRWAVSPSRRSSRRTHSSVTGGNSFRRRQYSASLGTDQTEHGNPRSEGFDKATSTSSRSCAARRIGGRPLGLGTCSKVLNPLAYSRRASSSLWLSRLLSLPQFLASACRSSRPARDL